MRYDNKTDELIISEDNAITILSALNSYSILIKQEMSNNKLATALLTEEHKKYIDDVLNITKEMDKVLGADLCQIFSSLLGGD